MSKDISKAKATIIGNITMCEEEQLTLMRHTKKESPERRYREGVIDGLRYVLSWVKKEL